MKTKIINITVFVVGLLLTAEPIFAQLPLPPSLPIPPGAPIDGGLSLLAAAGIGYGMKKMKNRKK